MKTVTTLPTDKHGRIYYGPSTYAGAVAIIEGIRNDLGHAPRVHALRQEQALTRRLREAGYARVAARIARDFCIAD